MAKKLKQAITHKIALRGNSLEIDEMYFPAGEIHFVDVVQQDPPIVRGVIIAASVGLFLLAAVVASFGKFHSLFPIIGIFIAIFGIIGICFAIAIKPRYALRISQSLGSTKCMISTDREELEAIRNRIIGALEVIRQNAENKPV